MPDALLAALETPGLVWLCLTIGAAGFIRGFTGFGTAMIFVPIGIRFLPTADVVFLMGVTGLASTLALAPQAWRDCDRGEVGTLALAATLTVPLGLWMMTRIDPLALRWMVAGMVGLTLLAVVTGWRWQGRPGWLGRLAIGGGGGVVGGMTGLTGPVVIVFYLANARDVVKVRANTIIFLALLDLVIVVNILLGGLSDPDMLWVALILSMPYLVTTLIGKRLFAPSLERIYRLTAYGVIALAVTSSLPIFD